MTRKPELYALLVLFVICNMRLPMAQMPYMRDKYAFQGAQ